MIIKKKNPWREVLKNDFINQEFRIYQNCCYFHDRTELKGFEDTDED